MSLFNNKRELAFISVAIVLFLMLVVFGFYVIRFLIRQVDIILNPAPPRITDTVQYNVKLLEDLKIIPHE